MAPVLKQGAAAEAALAEAREAATLAARQEAAAKAVLEAAKKAAAQGQLLAPKERQAIFDAVGGRLAGWGGRGEGAGCHQAR